MDILSLSALLAEHQIPVHTWGLGPTKRTRDLCREIERGECKLEIRDNRIVRIIRPVMVCIDTYRPETREHLALKEVERTFIGGRDGRRTIPTSLGEKMTPLENPIDGAIRAIEEELQLSLDANERVLVNGDGRRDHLVDECRTFPGLLTDMDRYWFTFTMPKRLFAEQYVERQLDKTTVFGWVPFSERPWIDVPVMK